MSAPSPVSLPSDPLVPANLDGWFGRVAGVVRRSFLRLLLIQVCVFVAMFIVGILLVICGFLLPWGDPTARGFAIGVAVALAIIGFVILMVFSAIAQVVSFFVAILDAAGEPNSIGSAFRFAVRRAFPLLGWWFLAGIMLIIGFLLLVIPGIYLVIVFNAALTGAVTLERRGIGRAFKLVNQRFWPTVGRLSLAFLIWLVCYGAVTIIGNLSGDVVNAILGFVFSVFVGFAAIAVSVVTYAELRFHDNPNVLTPALVAELRRQPPSTPGPPSPGP